MAKYAPFVLLDIIHPEVVKTLFPVPSAEKIHHVVDGVDAHRMATAWSRDIAICVGAMEALPYRVRLGSVEIRIE